jgi:hypothetical protein
MYPNPTKSKPALFFLEDKTKISKLCMNFSRFVAQHDESAILSTMEAIHQEIIKNPQSLKDVKAYEAVGIALYQMFNLVSLPKENKEALKLLKRNIAYMAYYCFSKHMEYYEDNKEALKLRKDMIFAVGAAFIPLVVRSMNYQSWTVEMDQECARMDLFKMCIADLIALEYLGEFPSMEGRKFISTAIKDDFAPKDVQQVAKEGDEVHKRLLSDLENLYIKRNEFNYMRM